MQISFINLFTVLNSLAIFYIVLYILNKTYKINKDFKEKTDNLSIEIDKNISEIQFLKQKYIKKPTREVLNNKTRTNY